MVGLRRMRYQKKSTNGVTVVASSVESESNERRVKVAVIFWELNKRRMGASKPCYFQLLSFP